MSKRFVCSVLFVLVMGLVLSSAVEAADPDLVGYWPFDMSTDDVSGNGNHGVVGGDPEWVPGKFNEALEFDGVDDYVALTNQPPITNGFTFSAWVRRDGDAQCAVFNNHQFFLRCRPEGENADNPWEAFIIWWWSGTKALSTVAATLGQWFFLVVTWDKTTLEIYVDGELAGSSLRSGELEAPVEARIGRGEQGNVNANPFNGVIDEVRIYSRVLTEEEIQQDMTTGSTNLVAKSPEPANEATDVAREVVLNWSPGEFANMHDVYFGTVFDDVNNATATVDPAGVYRGRQSGSTFTPDRLDLGQTYYWRVDEVNAAPDYTVFTGNVWQFTAEPVGYPIENIAVTASSENRATEGPGNTINGSGLDDGDLHSSESMDMWLTNMLDPNPAWIQFEFDRSYKLYQMRVWNYNSTVEPAIGFGVKEATVEYSVDGANWSLLGTTHEFARGPGAAGYAPNTIVDLGGAVARYVRITANCNWGGFLHQFGLSEVRLLYTPVHATEPSPDPGATDVDVDVTLSFRAGREAARHDVYLSTDEQAVIDGTVAAVSVTDASYTPSSLDLGSTYYWRIDEINDAETPTIWQGDVLNFTTQEFIVVDDFESYNDVESGQEGSNLVYETWPDGFGIPANGSTMGYNIPFEPTMETDTVHGGRQSAPMEYNNVGASFSEVTRTLAGQNWTTNGIQTLSLWFAGASANAPGQLYAKINGVQVNYDGGANNLTRSSWQVWNIDLAAIGTDLTSVTSLTIGVQSPGAAGILLLDDIRLYPYPRELITPAQPDPANLVGYWPLDGDFQDASGNNRHGTAVGGPIFVAGAVGQALELDGVDDYVNIDGYKGINADQTDPNNPVQRPFSIANWFRITETSGNHEMVTWGTQAGQQRVTWRVHEGRLRTEHASGNLRGNTYVNDGEWHHGALVVTEGANLRVPATRLFVDGVQDTVFSGADAPYNLTAGSDVRIGMSGPQDGRYFPGGLDEVRIYDSVLTEEGIAWLAGRIQPFDKPF